MFQIFWRVTKSWKEWEEMKDSFSIFIYYERFIFLFSMRYIEKFEYLDDIFKQSERDSSSQETSQSPDTVLSHFIIKLLLLIIWEYQHLTKPMVKPIWGKSTRIGSENLFITTIVCPL